MTLRKKTLIILGLTFAGLLIILGVISRSVILKNFENLELRETQRDTERVVSALNDDLVVLRNSTRDWASWDDAYTYVQGKNPTFFDSNLLYNSPFQSLRLNFMVYLNRAGKIIYNEMVPDIRHVDVETKEEIPAPESLKNQLTPRSFLLSHQNAESQLMGFLSLPDGLVLVASQPVLPSNRQGIIQGTAVFGRYLDTGEIERLSKTTLQSLTAYKVEEPVLPPDVQSALPFLEKSPLYIHPLSETLIASYVLLKDIYGKPIAVLRVEMERGVNTQGKAALKYFQLALLITGITFGLAVLLLLARLVLSPVTRLKTNVGDIAKSGKASGRVTVKGKDELADLACSVNRMLEALQSAEEERERLIRDLQEALSKVKTLTGLLPICASCKKIRDEKGYWNQVESYVKSHSEAEFTHTLCAECMKNLYPEYTPEGS